jgi:CTP:molybdopterin cytidylyltransferase MocA
MPAPILVVLAAGASRRYGRPKQLDPLGPHGETIMELTARDAVSAGVERIVLVVSESTGREVEERMRETARMEGWGNSVRIDAVRQRPDDLPAGYAEPPGRTRPWGTAHAVRAARPLLGGSGASIVVANADDWYGRDAIARIVEWAAEKRPPGAAALVPYPLTVGLPPVADLQGSPAAQGVSRGLLRAAADGRLTHLVEYVDLCRDPEDPASAIGGAPDGSAVRVPLDQLCSMNLWAFGPAIWYVLEHRFPKFLDARAGDARGARASAAETRTDTPARPNADMAAQPEWLLPDVVLAAARAGELDVRLLEPGTVHLGVTHPEDRERVRDALASAVQR